MPRRAYGKNALKALRAMKKTYGAKKGERVFYATANKRGKGKTRLSKVRSAYKKEGHK